MRKNLGVKTALYPQPVMIVTSYGEDGTADAMNAAWGGICGADRISMCLSAGHKTVKNILERGAFCVNTADEAHVVQCDYVGLVSANTVPDKLDRAGFHAVKSEYVDAPYIAELPLALECRLVSFDEETETMIGEIVNVSADDKIFDGEGAVDIARLCPIAFDPVNCTYLALGRKVGNAFCDGKSLK